MVRSNNKRKKFKNISFNLSKSGYYYPIYKGWVSKFTPFFETASAALCFQISRAKKDHLLDHNVIVPPEWMDVVGRIDETEFEKLVKFQHQTCSKIETSYFKHIIFYKLKEDCRVQSILVKVCKEGFVECLSTMKKETDYQASSSSIYKASTICLEEKRENHITNKFNQVGICQKRDRCNLINIVLKAKNIVSNENINSVEYILDKMHDLNIDYTGNELIVSLGAGSGVTEMASNKFCLCLDISKRSLFTGLTREKGTLSSNLTLFALLDYSENMEEFLKKVKTKLPNKTIRVLMQHPNPSLDEKNQYNMNCLFVSLKICL